MSDRTVHDYWLKRAHVCETRGFELQKLRDASDSSEAKAELQSQENARFAEADAYRKMAAAVALQIKNAQTGDTELSNSAANRAAFEFARKDFEAAGLALAETIEKFDEQSRITSDDNFRSKLSRAINLMKKDPTSFHFTSLNAPELIVSVETANRGVSMSGLDWPEAFRPTVWEAQRALIRYVESESNIRKLYAFLNDEDQREFAWAMP